MFRSRRIAGVRRPVLAPQAARARRQRGGCDGREQYQTRLHPGLWCPPRLRGRDAAVIDEANDWYFAMLRDNGRRDFFREALRGHVEGRVVLDVGAGCGLLSLLAAQLGARRVIAIESSWEMARLARVNAERNGFADRIRVINALSRDVCLPDIDLADVVVSETFGTLLLGEGALAHLADARSRLARPGALVVPGRGIQCALLVSSPTLAALSSAPDPIECNGLDISAANSLQDTASIYFTKDRGVRLSALPDLVNMAPRVQLAEVDFATADGPQNSVPKTVSVELEACQAGVIHAVVTSWEIFAAADELRGVLVDGTTSRASSHDAARNSAPGSADSSATGSRPEVCRLATHHEETARMPCGLFRDMQWGQGVQLLEDYDTSMRQSRGRSGRGGRGLLLPAPFAVETGEPLVLTASFSEPDRQALQLRLRRRGAGEE